MAFALQPDTAFQEDENSPIVHYDIQEHPGYSEATAPRTMSITLPTPPATESSEEARIQTLALVLASALMMTALGLAMGYIYYRNMNGEFLPEDRFFDFLVSRFAIIGLIGMIAAIGLLVFVSGDGIAEEPKEDMMGFDGDTSMYRVSGDATPTGTTYLLYEHHGGTWYDAEKTANNTDDDLMCWAIAGSNVLWWTGWGFPDGEDFLNPDDIRDYYYFHWSDDLGNPTVGWDWWFDGTNDTQGEPYASEGWAQVEVAGGGFYEPPAYDDYKHFSSDDSLAMDTIQDYITSGYGVTLSIKSGGGHSITCWGFNSDNPAAPTEYYGVWVTDSDDQKGAAYGDQPPQKLRYYEVAYDDTNDRWHLQDYYGSNNWYITEVVALEQRPIDTLTIDGTNDNNTITISDDGTAGNGISQIVMDSNPAISFSGIEELQIYGHGGNDTIRILSLDSDTDLISIEVYGGLGNDTLEISLSAGNLIPGWGIRYDGGGGTDDLEIHGGSCTDQMYNMYDSSSGRVIFDNTFVEFTGIEPIIDTTSATNFDIFLTSFYDDVNILDGTSTIPGVTDSTLVSSTTGTFESIEFANKTNVTINALDGPDRFTLHNPHPADGLSSLEIYGNELTDGLLNPDDDKIDTLRFKQIGSGVPTTFDGQGGNDKIEVRGQGNDILTLDATGLSIGSLTMNTNGVSGSAVTFEPIQKLEYFGQTGDDQFIINHPTVGALFRLPDHIFFDGGSGGNDSLTLNGGATTSMTYDYTNETDGKVSWTGGYIQYWNLSPITSTMNATSITMNFSGLSETITISDAGGDKTTVDSNLYGETTTFDNPSGDLTINAGDGGADTILLQGVGSGLGGDLILNGGTGNDTVTLSGGSNNWYITALDAGYVTGSNPFKFSSIEILNGGSGDDSLTIDFGSGNPIPAGGLTFNGGGEATGDSLTLQNGSFNNERYTVTGPNSGTIDFDGSLITFTGLEPIYDTVTVVQLDILLTSSAETINIIDGPGIGSFTTTEVNGTTFESTEFANKTITTINGLDGADNFVLNNPNSADGLITLKLYGNELTNGGLESDDGSNETFILLANSASVTLTSLYGHSGNDFFRHIWTPDGGNMTNLLGDIAMYGGPGSDDVALQNSNSGTANSVTLTSTTLTGAAPGTFTYGGIESVFYESSSVADTIDILSTNTGTAYTVSGDGGSDTFTIGNQSADFGTVFDGSLDTILGPITILADFNPTAGSDDTLNIDDSGTASLDSLPASITNMGSMSPMVVPTLGAAFNGDITRLSGFSPATMDYFHSDITNYASSNRLENLNVICSTGDDTVTVNDTTTTVLTTVDLFTGNDSNTMTIKGDTLSGGNLFKGNAGNDKFVLNITSDLGASSVFPITSLQIEGNAPASDAANRDILQIVDYGSVVRTLTFTYLTPVGGDIDITGLSIPMNIRTMETIEHIGDPGNDDVLTVVGTTSIDNFFVTALASDYAEVYINGGVGASAGPDLLLDSLHGTNGLTIDGDAPPFFTEPGDYLQYDGSGVLTFSGPGEGKIDGASVLDVNFMDIEILDATGTFNVIIDANSLAPGNMDDANADTFLVYRDPTGVGTYHRLEINGTIIYNIVFAVVSDLTINGSGDNDTMICDWGGGNPIPTNGIFFNGAGETGPPGDLIVLQNGTVGKVIHTYTNPTDGFIDVDGLVITYTGLSPIFDYLLASYRIFNFGSSSDEIFQYDNVTPGMNTLESTSSSEITHYANPSISMELNMGAGDDVLTIGKDDSGIIPGFDPGFTAALTINGDDGWDTINVKGPVGTPPPPEGTDQKLASIAFNVQLANLYQPMYSDDITGTCVIVNVWFPGLIQNGIDVCSDHLGAVITVYPGTYPENLTNWKPNIHLKSDGGAEVTIISASSGIILDLMTDTIGFTLGGAHGLGFTLLSTGTVSPDGVDKGLTGIDLVNLTVTHNSFKGPIMDFGICIIGVTTNSPHSLIMKNTFYNCGTAIAIFNGGGVNRLTITRNCIFDSIDHGILLGESPGGTGDMKFVVITENTISNSGIGLRIMVGDHILADFFVVKFNNFMGNTIGLLNETTLLVTAKQNFWDSPSGPSAELNYHGNPNQMTDGNPIQDYVLADPWLAIIHHPAPCDLSISLNIGWNLISITVELDDLGGAYTASIFASEMNNQAGEDIVKYIVRWDSVSGFFEEFVVATGVGVDFPIEYGRAYYIFSTSPFDSIFHIVGDCPVYETIDLNECWNLIGWKSMVFMDVGDFAEMIDHHAGWFAIQAIVKFDDTGGLGDNEYIAWYPGMDDDLFQLQPGEAYWVFVATNLIEVPYP